MIKLTFDSFQQLNLTLIGSGSRKVYFIDIPKIKGKDNDLIPVIEDLKNGYIFSVM